MAMRAASSSPSTAGPQQLQWPTEAGAAAPLRSSLAVRTRCAPRGRALTQGAAASLAAAAGASLDGGRSDVDADVDGDSEGGRGVGGSSGSGSDGDGDGGVSDGLVGRRSRREAFVLATRDEDTIASIVTGMSHGSVAIIRVSGSDAVPTASKVFRPGGRFRFDWQPKSHRVYYGTAVDGDETVLDEVLALVMLSPRSYTAEDVVELHCHGGPVCAARVLRAVIEAGARPAKAGEFTLRAFLNGRLDLAQAESVSELLSARTVAAADSALAGLRGGLGAEVAALRGHCLDVLVELEARLDFDEDLPPIDVPNLRARIEAIQAGIERALRTARTGNLLRRGLQVAIVGRPNVGKSSLLNAWTNSDRAIVTEVAGTTRDVLEAQLSVGGVPVTLLDTAGIRASDDVVERIGVERSRAAASAADIVVMVIDGAEGWTEADGEIYRGLWGGDSAAAGSSSQPQSLPLPLLARDTFSAVVRTSAAQRQGLEELDAALLQLAGAPQLASGGVSWSVNERQAEALVRSHEALMRLAESVSSDLPLDFWTIDLRAALLALGEVSGDEVGEEVLDAVFSRFCIGK
ncbi:hypothetical protein GPECTOR_2g1376 [Gonium pectorale]|uniref:TrmE-type G domain-containing protein n=1 Tax=Gonium pectorale TaxID=33097 RepID=A0A150H179_GONPE|nr:hypothetical protein GPECTOR_2g1376 [Gonium pectorale]|eukprot:KXZ55825.1 hypothetical protein GPECTOR_2g1376 [Gonium pectorale]